MSFPGFGPKALPFLKALAFHQDKAWFEANRAIYEEELRRPLEALLAQLSAELAASGLPLRGDARSIFRLHRDVRFSKDKWPYKTNAGAVLTRDGTKRSPGLLYLHLDPEGCFTAAGFWRPEREQLAELRRGIAGRPGAFREALARLGRAGLELSDGDPLARLPKGFEAVTEPDLAAAIRMRNLIVRRPLAEGEIASPELPARIGDVARAAEPLLRFGWEALGA